MTAVVIVGSVNPFDGIVAEIMQPCGDAFPAFGLERNNGPSHKIAIPIIGKDRSFRVCALKGG